MRFPYLFFLALISTVSLNGCANTHPESRGYTSAESRQLALEALNRKGLSFSEYAELRERIVHSEEL